MARTKAVLGAGTRLSDFLSASLLARVYPATMIGEILDEHGRNSTGHMCQIPSCIATLPICDTIVIA